MTIADNAFFRRAVSYSALCYWLHTTRRLNISLSCIFANINCKLSSDAFTSFFMHVPLTWLLILTLQ